MLPLTSARAPLKTSDPYHKAMRRQMIENVSRYAKASAAEIDERLAELDREWDVERTVLANATAACLAGIFLAALTDRWLLVLPALPAGLLLQQAVQDWCPLVPLFRRLGFRTAAEIEEERSALKPLRGDFRVSPTAARGCWPSIGRYDSGLNNLELPPVARLLLPGPFFSRPSCCSLPRFK